MGKNKIHVLIRVDASVTIGTGHVMRCLTLADMLRKEGVEAAFVCKELPGNLCNYIKERDYCVFHLPVRMTLEQESEVMAQMVATFTNGKKADWLIVDHYEIDAEWEGRIRSLFHRVLVIDDLANRMHSCDVLLDQNFYLDMETRYEGMVPNTCQLMLGPRYLLLRPEFYEIRKRCKVRSGVIRRLLLFFGGSDPTGETMKALLALLSLNLQDYGIHIDVIVGRSNPQREQIKQFCRSLPNATYYCQVENMAEMIMQADLALGAGGVAMWERCFLGLPSLVVAVASNQVASIEAAAHAGAVYPVGWHADVNEETWRTALKEMLNQSDIVHSMSKIALQLMHMDKAQQQHPVVRIMLEE